MMKRSVLALVLGLSSACASTSFKPTFKSPERPKPEQIAGELAAVPARRESAVIVAVASELNSRDAVGGVQSRLVAWDLAKGALWQAETNAQSAPIVAGNYVVTQEGDEVVVRDLATGVRRVSLDDGRLVGADGEGDAVVISLSYGAAQTGEPLGTLAFVKGGSLRWTEELKLAVGTPALVKNYVLVPWATHRLSVLDADDGAELARWYFNAAVLGHARVDRGRVYVGQHGLLRVRKELLEAKVDTIQMIAPALRTLPAQPPMLLDGYAVATAPDNAQHRVALEYRIDETDALEQDMFFARYYRMVFGLAGKEDRVRFATVLEHDVVGAEVVDGGLLVVDASGAVKLVDREGRASAITQMTGNLIAATVRASSVAAPVAVAGAAAPALEAQLIAAATLDDARLAMGRQYAVDHLARMPGATVTGELVAMCSDDKSPESVRRGACSHLGERDSGGEAVLAVLRDADRARPRIGALAKAAAKLQLKAAGALLAPHVLDARTHASELADLISALAALEHAPAASAIDRFLRLHHAEPEGSDLAPALHAASAALGALRAKPYRATLDRVRVDQLTAEGVRKSASEALLALDAPPPAKVVASAEPPAKPAQADKPTPVAPAPDPRPRYLSAELIDAALKPIAPKLRACVTSGGPTAQARVSMTIDGAGAVERVFVTPPNVQSCIEPLVRAQRFPATQQGRQQIAHVVHGRGGEKAQAPRALASADKKPK
jgi:hypothetical protein